MICFPRKMTNKSLTSTTSPSGIWWLESKLQGLFQQPCLQQWKDNFQTFAGIIEHQLGEVAYGGLHYNSFRIIGFLYCKICETCHPGSGPEEDWQLAPRHEDPLSAPVNQTSALLDPYWCYHYTRFTNQELQLLF